MAINFPNSPVTNDEHVVGSQTFVFDGTKWIVNSFVGYTGSAGAGFTGSQGIQGEIGYTGSIGSANIGGLTDVTITGVSTNDNLRYSGSAWVNEPERVENFTSVGTGTAINCALGNVFAVTPSTSPTYTFSNPPASGTAYGFTLTVTPSATVTITWPASVDWAGGAAPDAPASGETDVFAFFTRDGGTTWYGFKSGDAMA